MRNLTCHSFGHGYLLFKSGLLSCYSSWYIHWVWDFCYRFSCSPVTQLCPLGLPGWGEFASVSKGKEQQYHIPYSHRCCIHPCTRYGDAVTVFFSYSNIWQYIWQLANVKSFLDNSLSDYSFSYKLWKWAFLWAFFLQLEDSCFPERVYSTYPLNSLLNKDQIDLLLKDYFDNTVLRDF